MSLVNLFLFGLGLTAVAVPLWVHLRLGKVRKRAVVSTLRLMQATPQTSRSPRRLVDLPLFLLRAAILALLALGFGRLLIPGLPEDNEETAVVVLDVSASMQAQDGKTWKSAVGQTVSALKDLNRASQVAVVLSPSESSVPQWETPSRAIARVKELKPGYGANQLSAALHDAARLFAQASDDRPKVLYLVSDFQRSAFAGIDGVSLPADVELRLVKVGPDHLANRGVTVSVQSAGANDVGVYALSDGSGGTIQIEENDQTRSMPIAPGDGAARLPHSGKDDEWVARTLKVEDADALSADNTAYDVYRAQSPIPVWLWEPSGESGAAAGGDGGPRVYEQASYYVNRALQPAQASGPQADSRFRPVLLSADGLSFAAASVGQKGAPSLLVIPASGKLPPQMAELVRKLTDAGGSVIFFGGRELDPEAYQAAFGGRLGVKIGPPEEVSASPALEAIGKDNALWGTLDDDTRRLLALAPLHVRHALEALPGSRTLASYTDGVPFVVEFPAGKGRVFFVNTSADRSWSDLPASASLYVPAIHLLVARALGNGELSATGAPALAGEPASVRLPAAFEGRSLKVGEGRYPVAADGRVAGVVFETPGVKDLELEDGTKVGRIAVNFPPAESDLSAFSESFARQRLESLRRDGEHSAVRWEGREQGGLAWRLCLFAAALLLLIEPVVANQRTRA